MDEQTRAALERMFHNLRMINVGKVATTQGRIPAMAVSNALTTLGDLLSGERLADRTTKGGIENDVATITGAFQFSIN